MFRMSSLKKSESQNEKPNLAYIEQGKLLFEDDRSFNRALSEGFFFLRMPTGLDMSLAKKMSLNFYKPREENSNGSDNIYKGYTDTKNSMISSNLFHKGYADRENNQVESLYLTPDDLKKIPEELANIAHEMNACSAVVLKNILQRLNIPEVLWPEATGGCLEKGDFLWGFNHYRSEIEKYGAVAHKDSGWVTIVYSESKGLKAHINNTWVPINPIPGYFIVNFGSLLDVFSKDCKPQPAVASLHMVDQQYKQPGQEDRFSIVLYLQSNQKHENIYTYDPVEKKLNILTTYQKFFDKLVEIYDSNNEDLSVFSSNAMVNRSKL